MKKSYDVDELITILTDKGYNGYFKTQGQYIGKLGDSLNSFLKELDPNLRDKNVMLETYLEWNGKGEPCTHCLMSVENKNGRFELDVMDISHRDSFGTSKKRKTFTGLSINELPKKEDVVKMIHDERMKESYCLEEIVQVLTEKGYNEHFMTQAAYPDKLKDSLEKFFINEPECDRDILLKTYLSYNGDDKPRVLCYMWMDRKENGFDISKMDIEHRCEYYQLMKEVKLRGLYLQTIPTVKEALAMVIQRDNKKIKPLKYRFRR